MELLHYCRSPVLWIAYPHSTFGAWVRTTGGSRYWLTVERLDATEWEWLAWPAAAYSRCRSGRADSLAQAKQAAELAALALILEDGIDKGAGLQATQAANWVG